MNKKIRGTKSIVYNNIRFKSTLECNCYKKLEEAGLNPSYESEKIVLMEGFRPSIKLISPNKTKELVECTKKILNITYTPDFVVTKGNYKIYFDAKGIANDTYPIKKKLFLKHLENRADGVNYIFIEPHSIKQILQAIDYIKSL